jgi:hypothetical protein
MDISQLKLRSTHSIIQYPDSALSQHSVDEYEMD